VSAGTVLERIVSETRQEIERRKRGLPLVSLLREEPPVREREVPDRSGPAAGPRFRDVLAAPGLGVIAEFKRRSPSAGVLREDCEVGEIAGAYERGGAVALSVLTEQANFAGSLADLSAARAVSSLPILRKDFIVDRYQLHEARAVGADAVLLIVAALAAEDLRELHEEALAIGLDVLVEVHDRGELDRALALGPATIGINNRDLRDLSVDIERTFGLLESIPAGVTVISESGIRSAAQMRRLGEAGVDGVLVGESLMRAADPEAALRALADL
jgi:indole-3-glycerol phosphate synthase